MMRLNKRDCLWVVGQGIKNLGLWGMLGLVVLMIASIVYTLKMTTLSEETALKKAEFKQLNVEKNRRSIDLALHDHQHDFQVIDALFDSLPLANQLPDILLKINACATAQHLLLNSGEYQFIQMNNSRVKQLKSLVKYDVKLPIRGSYAQMRAFITQVLFDFPSLALVDLKFKRESLQLPEIEAELLLTIYVKEDLMREKTKDAR